MDFWNKWFYLEAKAAKSAFYLSDWVQIPEWLPCHDFPMQAVCVINRETKVKENLVLYTSVIGLRKKEKNYLAMSLFCSFLGLWWLRFGQWGRRTGRVFRHSQDYSKIHTDLQKGSEVRLWIYICKQYKELKYLYPKFYCIDALNHLRTFWNLYYKMECRCIHMQHNLFF